jgi:hypothetical protein
MKSKEDTLAFLEEMMRANKQMLIRTNEIIHLMPKDFIYNVIRLQQRIKVLQNYY